MLCSFRESTISCYQVAKDLLAGFAGAEADSEFLPLKDLHVTILTVLELSTELFETHGLNFLDREKAKHEAKSECKNHLPMFDAATLY